MSEANGQTRRQAPVGYSFALPSGDLSDPASHEIDEATPGHGWENRRAVEEHSKTSEAILDKNFSLGMCMCLCLNRL